MSTENVIDNAAATPEEEIAQGLSIDQPINNVGPIVPIDYDGAPASDGDVAEVTTKANKKLLRMDLGDGNVYTAETERELLQKIADGKREANRTIRELKQAQAAPPPQSASVTVVPRNPVNNADLPEKYDQQTYLTMLGEDPLKAQRYINRELYGMDPVEALRDSVAVSGQVRQSMVVAEFQRRNPEYVSSTEASEAIMGVLKQNGLPPDSIVNLEWAYTEAKRTGRLNAPEVNADGEIEYEDIVLGVPTQITATPPTRTVNASTVPVRPQSRGAGAPMAARGSSNTQAMPSLADPNSMSLDELRAMIDSKQPLRR